MYALPNGWDLLTVFAISLAVGLLVDLERERNPAAKAGLRTFALTALLGCVAAMLQQAAQAPWLLAASLALVGLMMVASHARPAGDGGAQTDPGTTTVVAIARRTAPAIRVRMGTSDSSKAGHRSG